MTIRGFPSLLVQTVTGPRPAGDLGVTLPHEHVLWDSHYVDHPTERMEAMRSHGTVDVTDELLPTLARNPFATGDNLRQTSVDLAVAELSAFREAGGGCVVDVTCIGLGRDAAALRRVSEQSGVAIVAPTGYYLAGTHPPQLASWDAGEIADRLLRELTEGIDGTDVRAGIIGELGVGQPMYDKPPQGASERADIDDAEIRVLEAAALAHRATGAPISIHLWNFGPNSLAARTLDILESAGVRPDRVALGHLDAWCDLPAIRAVARRGALVEFDAFGVEPYEGWDDSHFDTDEGRVENLLRLIDEGFADRLMISQDVCTKVQLHAFGGHGYDHIERTIVPRLIERGLDGATLAAIRVTNPARFLAWDA